MMKSPEDPVLYRLQRARQTFDDARLLANASRWNPCVNRLYYACFYAVSGLLLQDGLSSSKHTGVRSLFNRHYVRTGKVPCATRRDDGMGGKPHRLYRQAVSRWGVAPWGCNHGVK